MKVSSSYASLHNNMLYKEVEQKRRALVIILEIDDVKAVEDIMPDRYISENESPYLIYENAKSVTVAVAAKAEEKGDNAGPCTSNINVDAAINVEAYICTAKRSNEESIAASGDKFTFYNLENYKSVSDAYYEALVENYTYLHQEALQHDDPAKFIKDKYTNPASPFYAKDLTWYERDIAYRYEEQMLKCGKIHGVHYQDSLFRGREVNALQSSGDERRYNRKVMNTQLSNILKNNGLSVPEGVRLRCTIDPHICYIKIEDITDNGIKRKGLCEKLEKAINTKENGINLYQHIIQSSYSAVQLGSTQYNYEGRIKFQYYHNTDGASYGMSGDYNRKFADYCAEYYPAYADKAKRVGFDGFEDMYLYIDITSSGFEDAYQDVNWTDDADAAIQEWRKRSAYTTI